LLRTSTFKRVLTCVHSTVTDYISFRYTDTPIKFDVIQVDLYRSKTRPDSVSD